MYHTNEAYKQAVTEYPQRFKLSIDVIFDESDDLENITIPPDDIFEASFDESAFGLGTFKIGGAAATIFSVKINNSNGKYSNDAISRAELHPKFTLYDENETEIDTVPVGVFFTNTISVANSDLNIDSNDKMSFGGDLYILTNQETNLYDIGSSIARRMNANLATTPADIPLLSSIKVNDSIFENYSNMQVISFIAAATGSFAIFNYDGDLEFKWFKKTDIELRGDWANKPIELNGNTFTIDNNPVKITGVRIIDGDTVVASAGTDETVIEITDNPIALTDPTAVATFVYNKIKDTIYIPAIWRRIGGDPSIQVGDILTVIDNKERYNPEHYEQYPKYSFYVSQKNWKYKGSFSDVYEAGQMSQQSKNKGMTVSKQVSVLKKQIKDIQAEITTGLDDRQQALLLFNEKMYASMGLHQTVEKDGKGGLITYMHDESTLEASKTIYKYSSAGFAWTTSGWNEGNPVWTSGLADNGDAILNQIYAYVINADLIKTGLLRSKNGASWINMDNGTFCFRKATSDGWLDIDTGEVVYTYEDLLRLDEDGELNIFGIIRSVNSPHLSAAIGVSETGKYGAFTVTDNSTGYGDIFQVYGVARGDEVGTVWTAPFLLNPAQSNRKGIAILPTEISVFADEGNVSIEGNLAKIETKDHTIQINQRRTGNDIWFNYVSPPAGYYATQIYCFGNNSNGATNGGYGDIQCFNVTATNSIIVENSLFVSNSIYASIDITTRDAIYAGRIMTVGKIGAAYANYALSVYGSAKADSWAVSSDRSKKTNIVSQDNISALEKINTLKFYEYDFKPEEKLTNESTEAVIDEVTGTEAYTATSLNAEAEADSTNTVHISMGIMADEAPEEIQSDDGKGIDLYSYISMAAKAIQELSAEVESLKAEIAQLKSGE